MARETHVGAFGGFAHALMVALRLCARRSSDPAHDGLGIALQNCVPVRRSHSVRTGHPCPDAWSLDNSAPSCGLDLKVPYFVIQGRNDPRCPPEAARAFVDQVHAPAKNFTAIDGGHFACLSNPTGFLNALDSDIHRLRISPPKR